MNALLIYPEWPDTYWSFKHALPFEGKRSAYPPLGLLTIAPLLPKHWKKRLVDTNVCPLTDADLKWADIALLSGMLVHKQDLLTILTRCRSRGLRTVIGGPVSSSVEELPRHADHVVIGEAEDLIAGLAADLEQGRAKPVYQARELPGLDKTPLPDLSLINPKYYSAMAIQYSRGCPFNCEFCDIIEIYGRKPRTKSPAQVVAELQQLYERKWRGSVFIVDDNFIGNKRKVKEMLPVLAEWNLRHQRPFNFFTEASVNLADDSELLQMMKEACFKNRETKATLRFCPPLRLSPHDFSSSTWAKIPFVPSSSIRSLRRSSFARERRSSRPSSSFLLKPVRTSNNEECGAM